jgi:hypothetical protein
MMSRFFDRIDAAPVSGTDVAAWFALAAVMLFLYWLISYTTERKRQLRRVTEARYDHQFIRQSLASRRMVMGPDDPTVQRDCVALLVTHHEGYPLEGPDAALVGGHILQAMEDLQPISPHAM